MQCSWSRQIGSLIQILSYKPIRNTAHLRLRSYVPVNQTANHPLSSQRHISSSSNIFTQNLLKHNPIRTNHTNPANPLDLTVPHSLTAAQLSRAAAHAVRISCENGALNDAFYIVNSLRHSSRPDKVVRFNIPGVGTAPFQFIDFGQPVPLSLSAHTLLHYLTRSGKKREAYRYSTMLMADCVKLHPRTLQAVIQVHVTGGRPHDRSAEQHQHCDTPGSSVLHPSMLADPSTRCAMTLLMSARRHRQRCSEQAYQTLINACLVQGEIIVAALLFVLLVKDWEVRRKMEARLRGQIEEEWEVASTDSPRDTERYLRARLATLLAEPKLDPSRFAPPILKHIKTAMLRDPSDESSAPIRLSALQALAHIAGTLDRQEIPFDRISTLIHVLYSCPKVTDRVWVSEDGNEQRVAAHPYFHRVLLRLIRRLPSKPLPKTLKGDEKMTMLPRLRWDSYNSLIHYALRHRFSPALANGILRHMTRLREPPIEPDVATYNIMIRAGTLLRRPDISEQAIDILRQVKQNANHGITVQRPHPVPTIVECDPKPEDTPTPVPVKQWSTPLGDRPVQDLDLPLPNSTVTADAYTLTSYILHLTSTGQPQAVVDVLFHILPELSIIDHPSWGSATEDQKKEMRRQSRRARLLRAVTLGPRFFIAILNALSKARQTGLTERVWLLAKQAERASWIPGIQPDVQPWCLPVHAYTIMLRQYSAEARSALQIRHPGQMPNGEQADWVPKPHANVHGWALYVVDRQKDLVRRRRRRRALRMASSLFRTMFYAAKSIYEELLNLQQTAQTGLENVQMPSPDARFFNSALQLYAQQQYRAPRLRVSSRAHWRRKLKLARVRYAKYGVLPRKWNPFLARIVEEMVNAGYPIPLGLRSLFVGHPRFGFTRFTERPELNKQPFLFPRPVKRAFRPHALHTLKKRGLPFSGKKVDAWLKKQQKKSNELGTPY